jgi:hypothetical protein
MCLNANHLLPVPMEHRGETNAMPSNILTVPRLARYLGISETRAQALVDQEIVPSFILKGTKVALREDADIWHLNQKPPTVSAASAVTGSQCDAVSCDYPCKSGGESTDVECNDNAEVAARRRWDFDELSSISLNLSDAERHPDDYATAFGRTRKAILGKVFRIKSGIEPRYHLYSSKDEARHAATNVSVASCPESAIASDAHLPTLGSQRESVRVRLCVDIAVDGDDIESGCALGQIVENIRNQWSRIASPFGKSTAWVTAVDRIEAES